jgi:hypothetical protein
MNCAYCETEFVHSKLTKRCCSVKCMKALWYREHKDHKQAYNKKYYISRK